MISGLLNATKSYIHNFIIIYFKLVYHTFFIVWLDTAIAHIGVFML